MSDTTAYGQGDWRDPIGSARVSPLEERRQRAREAYSDASPVVGNDVIDQVHAAVDEAIETATRVRITDEAVRALLLGVDRVGMNNGGLEVGIAAALRELGFEVEE